MMRRDTTHIPDTSHGLMTRLAADSSGNTLMLMAAGLLPLMAMIGGGVDISRAYLAESRLQQACDAGVLAARKELGSQVAAGGSIPSTVATIGHEFFDLNYQDGQYGTKNTNFQMMLEGDYSITGTASVDVPTTLMTIFGFDNVPVDVNCGSQLNFPNIDLMMVLDVTGSMRHTNSGDSLSRIDSLRQVVKNFHNEIESNKNPGTRMRYGFVPYSTNVNVGHLLQDDWMVKEWTYQSRVEASKISVTAGRTYERNWSYVSGTRDDWDNWPVESTYPATWNAGATADQAGYYSCNNALPADTVTYTETDLGNSSIEVQGSPPAILYVSEMQLLENGRRYKQELNGNTCEVQYLDATNYVQNFERVTEVPSLQDNWTYKPVKKDVTNWRSETAGCIEERKSSFISDYNSVDLSVNPDLDIDRVPTAGDADTQWRPRYPDEIYARSWTSEYGGSWTTGEVTSPDDYYKTGNTWWSACPAAAKKLSEMTAAEVDTYLNTFSPYGATYHDIGMIWGARLLSPTGLFSADNVDVGASSTSRHLVFLTDGQTEPYDMAYGAYGVEPLDQRRWDSSSAMSLQETVNERFLFACKEAKKKNITVWVIAFGTSVNKYMTDCAGGGRYFEAKDATELAKAFSTIAQTLGDLRVSS